MAARDRGMHRLHLDDGRVTLTLVFADVLEALRGLAPRRRRILSRRVRARPQPGNVVAVGDEGSCTTGAARCRRLQPIRPRARARRACRRPASRWRNPPALDASATCWRGASRRAGATRHPASRPASSGPSAARWSSARVSRESAIAERLASRGWRVSILDRDGARPAVRRDSTPGVLQPHLSRDDCILSRFTRAGFLYAHSRRRSMDCRRIARRRVRRAACCRSRMTRAMRCGWPTISRALAYPAEYAQLLSRDAASSRARPPGGSGRLVDSDGRLGAAVCGGARATRRRNASTDADVRRQLSSGSRELASSG